MRVFCQIGLYFLFLSVATPLFASDFSLPFVNSAGLGVAYADWASAAEDASTAYTNPAGLVNLREKQMVINLIGVTGGARYTGSSLTPPYPFPFSIAQSGVAHTDINAVIPSFYFSAPMSERFTLGLSITGPFGLGTDYGLTSIVRYAATKSKVVAMDLGPSVGFKLTDLVSLGIGLDLVRLAFTLNNLYGPPLSFPVDSQLENHLRGWGASWHTGVLLQMTPKTRVGISYHGKITVVTTGDSTVYLPTQTFLSTNSQRSKVGLPARAQLSIQHDWNERWRGMATVFYTHWKTFNQVLLENTQTPMDILLPVTIPFNYNNCFDYALGIAYTASDNWLLRAGILFFNTPSNDLDRNVADPIGKALIPTVGARFKLNKRMHIDVGVGHSFFKQMAIHYSNPLTRLNGHTNAQTTAIGGQWTWDIS